MPAVKKKKDGRGGARQGSGRKPFPDRENILTETICVAVTKDIRRKYEKLKERGVNPGHLFADTIDNLSSLLGIDAND